MEHDEQCILVVIGADQWIRKELCWQSPTAIARAPSRVEKLLLDLKKRGLEVAPELAVGDGALGFWKALRESHGTTREQRCRLHLDRQLILIQVAQVRRKPRHQRGTCRSSGWPRPMIGLMKAFDFFLEA